MPDGRDYLAVSRQTSGKTTGNLGSAWGSLLYQKDICLILNFYRFSHIWLAGEGSWRNIEGCRHTAVKTKLDEAAGSSNAIPAEPRFPHCHFQHWHCQVHNPGASCGALQECLWLPRFGHNASSRSHGASWGTEERKRGAGSFQKRQESKEGEVSGGTRGGYETVCVRVSHIKVKRSG